MTDPIFDTIYGPLDEPAKLYDPDELLGPVRNDLDQELDAELNALPCPTPLEDINPELLDQLYAANQAQTPRKRTLAEQLRHTWGVYSRWFNL